MTLNTIKKQLEALSPDELRSPNLPMPVALQEAHDLLRFCQGDIVSERLRLIGLPSDFTGDLEVRIDAAREAQSNWVAVRDQRKSDELVELEQSAASLRGDLIAAGRFHLRSNEAQATLSQIRGGDTVADLVQDLFDLAKLFERNEKGIRCRSIL